MALGQPDTNRKEDKMQQKPYRRRIHVDLPDDIHVRLVQRQLEFEPIHNVIKRLLDKADAQEAVAAETKP